MRNLKRALSLALAAIMLIGMMVVGASAASYNEFTDRDEIVNKDAVSMLTTLGVIDGKTDGSFDPTGSVRRDEMAKMISVIMNQGSDNNDLFSGVNSGLTDVAGNWAIGHINYCYSLGIIAGRGDGRFDPAANVTASEAAKMLLVAAGYNPVTEGFVGADWAINVNAKASALGVYRNFSKNVMQPLSRDDAALLIYNALDVEMIQKYENGYAIAYEDHRTILSAMYGVYKVEGVVVANEWAQLQETGSDAALRAGKTVLDDVMVYSSTTANTTTGEGVREREPVTFNVETSVDMLGKTVTLYIEKTTILANSKVLGVSTKDDVNVIKASTAKSSTLSSYLKGTGISVGKDTEYYVNYGYCEDGGDEAIAIINEHPNRDLGQNNQYFNVNGVSVEVIDNDDDGIAEYVLYVQETLSEVNRYNDKSETVTFYKPARGNNGALTGNATTSTLDFEDVVFVDEVATDDLILYVQYGGRTYISLADVVTGKMSRVDRDRDSELYITVEGETYKQSFIPDAASMVDVELTHFDIDDARSNDMVGFTTEYDFILDSTGEYVVAVRPAEKTVTNYALVLGSAWTQNALSKSGQVKILKADGTTSTYDINWSKSRSALADIVSINGDTQYDSDGNGTMANISALSNDEKLELYLGSRDVHNVAGQYGVNAAEGSVITYSLSSEDVLTIESILQGNTWDNDNDLEISNAANARTTAGVADNGVILYLGTNAADDNLQYNVGNVAEAAASGYENGDGTITLHGVDETAASGEDRSSMDKNYAVDLNTVAFYYYEDGGDTVYGVATGWDDMSDVAAGTDAQVYPVLEKAADRTYRATNLAEVLLFEAVVNTETSDYALVLDANAATKDTWHLTVVFEDGLVKEITVDDDDLGSFDPEDDDHFMQAWTYSENSDGTYKIGTRMASKGTAYLLKTGTVDMTVTNGVALANPYIALSGKANVWNVTDVEYATDTTVMGSFTKTRVNAVVVMDNGAIRTAWIWDIPQSADPGTSFDTDTVLVDVDVDDQNNLVTITYTGAVPSDASIRTLIEQNLLAYYSNTTNGEAKNVEITRFNSAAQSVTVRITMSANAGVSTAAWTYALVNDDAALAADDANWGTTGSGAAYTPKGTWTVDGNTVTATGLANTTDMMNDTARFLGALYRTSGATEIRYGGRTYKWDTTGTLKGSNWTIGGAAIVANTNTLVSAIKLDLDAGTRTLNLVVDGVAMTIALS